mgnify:FL=1
MSSPRIIREMKRTALLYLLFSFRSYSAANFCGDAPQFPAVQPDIEKIYTHLDRHGASDEQIMAAACKRKKPPGSRGLKKYLLPLTQTGSVTETINGVTLEDESLENIELFKKFTTMRHHLTLAPLPTKQQDVQELFEINPKCKKLVCAVEKIWGEELGTKLLYLYNKHRFIGSELAFNFSARYETNEIDDVLIALGDLPEAYVPMGDEVQPLYRFSVPNTPQTNTTLANAGISLFDLWTKQSSAKRQYTIFHEISHNIATKLNKADRSPEWHKFSGWVKNGNKWEYTNEACLTSMYGATSPEEDWAESLSTYRYAPHEFKKNCPAKYDYIKNLVFGGIEYLSKKDCSK